MACLAVHPVWADSMDTIGTWSWSGTNSSVPGYTFTGSATFYNICVGGSCPVSGTYELEIVLQNTDSVAAPTNPAMLGGFMFDVAYASGAPGALSMLSATADLGTFATKNTSTVTAGSAGTNVCAPGVGENGANPGAGCTATGGWEAAYNATGVSPTDAPGSNWGVGSAGFSSAGPGGTGVFNGSNVGNVDYEIAPSAGAGFNGSNNYPVVDKEITFIFTGLTQEVTSVSNVYGWYGTAPDSMFAGQPTTPEPAAIAELAVGASLLAVICWRRRKRVEA